MNRTYGTPKTYIFTDFYPKYSVLFTMVLRDRSSKQTSWGVYGLYVCCTSYDPSTPAYSKHTFVGSSLTAIRNCPSTGGEKEFRPPWHHLFAKKQALRAKRLARHAARVALKAR